MAAGCLVVQFQTDCDIKLLSHQVVSWLYAYGSILALAPAGRQLSNDLVECHWHSMVEMAQSYLTETQMPHSFWFAAIQHGAHMINCIPGKVHNTLTTPFELSHHSPLDTHLWFPLFLVGYSTTCVMGLSSDWVFSLIHLRVSWLAAPIPTMPWSSTIQPPGSTTSWILTT